MLLIKMLCAVLACFCLFRYLFFDDDIKLAIICLATLIIATS